MICTISDGIHILVFYRYYLCPFLLSRCINVGRDFQAELPTCFVGGDGPGVWSPEVELPPEQLLWKPWDELEETTSLEGQGKWHAGIELSDT